MSRSSRWFMPEDLLNFISCAKCNSTCNIYVKRLCKRLCKVLYQYIYVVQNLMPNSIGYAKFNIMIISLQIPLWMSYRWEGAIGGRKWNESGFRPPLCTYRLNWARRTSWGWWDDRDDTVLQTGFEIRALAVWGRARYLSVTEAPHNTDFHTLMGKKHFCFFQTAETGNRTPNSGVKGSGANHYPRAPAQPDNLLAFSRTNTLTLILLNLFYYKLWRCSLRLMTWCEICYHIL